MKKVEEKVLDGVDSVSIVTDVETIKSTDVKVDTSKVDEAKVEEAKAKEAIHNVLRNEELGFFINKNPYAATIFFKDGNTQKIPPGGTTKLLNRALVSRTDVRVLFNLKK